MGGDKRTRPGEEARGGGGAEEGGTWGRREQNGEERESVSGFLRIPVNMLR